MAKELPYFKFEPSEWDNGNIQMCSRESKGLFADLCSLYWSRLGELPYALALQKLCNGSKDAMQELIDHEIFGIIEGQIVIDFLDEQLQERGQTSDKRRNAAQKRWSNANALQLESKSNANRREEKKKEEKREELNPDFEIWTKSIFEGNDSLFEQMLMKENFTLGPENFDFLCRDHLGLLSRYPKMRPDSQQKFRNSLMKHIRENYQKVKSNGKSTGIEKIFETKQRLDALIESKYGSKTN